MFITLAAAEVVVRVVLLVLVETAEVETAGQVVKVNLEAETKAEAVAEAPVEEAVGEQEGDTEAQAEGDADAGDGLGDADAVV